VLRENLASSSKFGFSVLGVTVTSRLLDRLALRLLRHVDLTRRRLRADAFDVSIR